MGGLLSKTITADYLQAFSARRDEPTTPLHLPGNHGLTTKRVTRAVQAIPFQHSKLRVGKTPRRSLPLTTGMVKPSDWLPPDG